MSVCCRRSNISYDGGQSEITASLKGVGFELNFAWGRVYLRLTEGLIRYLKDLLMALVN